MRRFTRWPNGGQKDGTCSTLGVWAKPDPRDWSDYVANRGPQPGHKGGGAAGGHTREPDYRLCSVPRIMRISRTPLSTWTAPSATKPCLR